jgi:hypothetical protein
MKFLPKIKLFIAFTVLLTIFNQAANSQSYLTRNESERSDKITGGRIEKTALQPGEGDIRITVNVPAFQLTLWQNDREVKTYFIGVGMKDYPIYIGERFASEVIWNPNWIPPASDWVKGFKPGTIIKPTDPRNPLGKLKIPLGDGYLIHQAKGKTDLGSLVSHGCVRMMLADLYDLAEKIVAARSLPVSAKQIRAAKQTKKTLAARLDPNVPVEITYDTMVVEAGQLHIYPDVYDLKTNTIANLRRELETSGIDHSQIADRDLARIIARAAAKKQFVVSRENIEAGRETSGGRTLLVVGAVSPRP